MSASVQKGMILAAGLGTRLHPITHKVPKPLVPVLNIPNILYSIDLLARAGVKDIVINVHHLRKHLMNALSDGKKWNVHLTYSQEEVLLGTGGGVKKAEAHFQGKPFLLTNSDFITDANLTSFVSEHFKRKSLASMLLIDDARLAPFYSKVGTDGSSQLCSLPSLTTKAAARTGIFTGLHLIDSEMLKHLQPVPSGINQILYPKLMKENESQVFGSYLEGSFWLDTGDLHFLWDTSMRLLHKLTEGQAWLKSVLATYGKTREVKPGLWCAEGVSLDDKVDWKGPVVVGTGCTIDAKTQIGPYSVIGEGSRVGAGCRLQKSVLLPNSRVTAGTDLESGLWFESESLSTKKNSAGE